MADALTPEQIAEYEAQLEGIEQLLEASPDDEALLTLKRDLQELLALSKASELPLPPPPPPPPTENDSEGEDEDDDSGAVSGNTSPQGFDLDLPPPPPLSGDSAEAAIEAGITAAADANADITSSGVDGTTSEGADGSKKKKQKLKEFVVPPHLIAQDTDSEAERNRKRRALKALKNKWREKKKEVESDNKKKSWQSFQKKTKRKDANSIFATQEGVNDRVGVISKKQMTEFGSRKRHKGL